MVTPGVSRVSTIQHPKYPAKYPDFAHFVKLPPFPKYPGKYAGKYPAKYPDVDNLKYNMM